MEEHNHNPNNVKAGQTVILDDRHEVKVIELTPLQMYAKVESDNDQWTVMTYRLKPI